MKLTTDIGKSGFRGRDTAGLSNGRGVLPTDKMLILVLVFATISLGSLFFSILIESAQNPAWSGQAEIFGWTGIVSAIVFICLCLLVKGVEFLWTQMVYSGRGDKALGVVPYGVLACLAAASISIASHGMTSALKLPAVKRVVIHLTGLPRSFEGIRIVQVSDLHITASMERTRIRAIVDRVNALDPDIIAFTGDIFDAQFADIREKTAELSRLQSKWGKFFVTGNHEQIHGADDWSRAAEALGFMVLFNDHCLIGEDGGGMLIAGVPDPRDDPGLPSPAVAIGKGKKAGVKILLAHRPDIAQGAEKAGFDLLLCGHTHDGQIRAIALMRSLLQPFQSGLYRFNDLSVYVSSGAGYWGIPLRFGTCSEISLIELTGVKTGTLPVPVEPARLLVRDGW